MDHLIEQASRATTVAIIRMKLVEQYSKRGVKLTKVDGTTMRTDDGGYVTLENLVSRCLAAPRKYWNEIVEVHVERMIESQRLSNPDYLLSLPDDEFYMRLRERVAPLGILRNRADYAYSEPFVDGSGSPRRVLNLTFPDLALTLTDQFLANRDLQAAWAFGRENTAALKFDDCELLVSTDVTLEVRRGNSIYLASKVADMPRLIRDHIGEAPFGVLFAIPSAYEIIYYKPTDVGETVHASEKLLGLARGLSTDMPNPLSSDVYFWRDGEYSRPFPDGAVDSTSTFGVTLRELADG